MLAEKASNKIHEGRWTTPDALGGDVTNPQSLNRYAYAMNNPTTLTDLEHKLNPRDFQRIHRSTLVNVQRIKEIHPWFHSYHLVVLANRKDLRMSRYQTITGQRLGLGMSRGR